MRHLFILSLAAAASWAAAGPARDSLTAYPAQDTLPAYTAPQYPFLMDQPGATKLVDYWYTKYLGRSASTDPSSAWWVNQLVQGKPPISVLAGVLSSQEFFESASKPDAFINHLFTSVLGRKPTWEEAQAWGKRAYVDDIQDNEIRRNIVYDFLSTYERDAGGGSIVLPPAVLRQSLQRQQEGFNLNPPYYPYQN
jgi:hypothetical protein